MEIIATSKFKPDLTLSVLVDDKWYFNTLNFSGEVLTEDNCVYKKGEFKSSWNLNYFNFKTK